MAHVSRSAADLSAFGSLFSEEFPNLGRVGVARGQAPANSARDIRHVPEPAANRVPDWLQARAILELKRLAKPGGEPDRQDSASGDCCYYRDVRCPKCGSVHV